MQSITTEQLAQLGDDVTLIDVREPDEFAEARVPFAVNLPMSQLGERVDELPAEGTTYVICRSGGRSSRVIEALEGRGWNNLVNVDGGTTQWLAEGRPAASGDA